MTRTALSPVGTHNPPTESLGMSSPSTPTVKAVRQISARFKGKRSRSAQPAMRSIRSRNRSFSSRSWASRVSAASRAASSASPSSSSGRNISSTHDSGCFTFAHSRACPRRALACSRSKSGPSLIAFTAASHERRAERSVIRFAVVRVAAVAGQSSADRLRVHRIKPTPQRFYCRYPCLATTKLGQEVVYEIGVNVPSVEVEQKQSDSLFIVRDPLVGQFSRHPATLPSRDGRRAPRQRSLRRRAA